jgi:hypothetical protein
VGLDGYLRTPGTTYSGVFGHTLSLAAKLGKPILLAETGVLIRTPGAARRIGEIYRGAGRSLDVIGVIYFDSRTPKFGDYRPQDNRAALAAFRRGVTGLQRPPLSR